MLILLTQWWVQKCSLFSIIFCMFGIFHERREGGRKKGEDTWLQEKKKRQIVWAIQPIQGHLPPASWGPIWPSLMTHVSVASHPNTNAGHSEMLLTVNLVKKIVPVFHTLYQGRRAFHLIQNNLFWKVCTVFSLHERVNLQPSGILAEQIPYLAIMDNW